MHQKSLWGICKQGVFRQRYSKAFPLLREGEPRRIAKCRGHSSWPSWDKIARACGYGLKKLRSSSYWYRVGHWLEQAYR